MRAGNTAADYRQTINHCERLSQRVANYFTQGGQFSAGGQLFIPGDRGVITLLPGDYVGVDSTGWPIVVSANAIANGPWTHT